MREPGVEPGSIAWKATMLTATPLTPSGKSYIFPSDILYMLFSILSSSKREAFAPREIYFMLRLILLSLSWFKLVSSDLLACASQIIAHLLVTYENTFSVVLLQDVGLLSNKRR